MRQGLDEEFLIQKRITDLGFDFIQGDAPCTETRELPVSIDGGTALFKPRRFPLF